MPKAGRDVCLPLFQHQHHPLPSHPLPSQPHHSFSSNPDLAATKIAHTSSVLSQAPANPLLSPLPSVQLCTWPLLNLPEQQRELVGYGLLLGKDEPGRLPLHPRVSLRVQPRYFRVIGAEDVAAPAEDPRAPPPLRLVNGRGGLEALLWEWGEEWRGDTLVLMATCGLPYVLSLARPCLPCIVAVLGR